MRLGDSDLTARSVLEPRLNAQLIRDILLLLFRSAKRNVCKRGNYVSRYCVYVLVLGVKGLVRFECHKTWDGNKLLVSSKTYSIRWVFVEYMA